MISDKYGGGLDETKNRKQIQSNISYNALYCGVDKYELCISGGRREFRDKCRYICISHKSLQADSELRYGICCGGNSGKRIGTDDWKLSKCRKILPADPLCSDRYGVSLASACCSEYGQKCIRRRLESGKRKLNGEKICY